MIKQDLRVPPYANNTHQRLLHALLIDSLYIIPCNLLFFLNQTYFTHTDYHFYFNIDGVFSAPHKPAEHPHILYPQQMLQTPSRTREISVWYSSEWRCCHKNEPLVCSYGFSVII